MTSQMMFYGGIGCMIFAVVLGIIVCVVLFVKNRQLQHQLVDEYGDRRRRK